MVVISSIPRSDIRFVRWRWYSRVVGTPHLKGADGAHPIPRRPTPSSSSLRVFRSDRRDWYWRVIILLTPHQNKSQLIPDRRRLIALLLGRLRMTIDKAIACYISLTEKVFSSTQIGSDGKFSSKALEDALKKIMDEECGNPAERIMDNYPSACKT